MPIKKEKEFLPSLLFFLPSFVITEPLISEFGIANVSSILGNNFPSLLILFYLVNLVKPYGNGNLNFFVEKEFMVILSPEKFSSLFLFKAYN